MLKIGVIGVGNMGRNHLRVVTELNNFYEVVGFYDANEERAKIMEEAFKVRGYKDIDELLDKVDACVVAVPSSMHLEIGKKVAAKKVHALIEKPLCLTEKDAIELKEIFAKENLKLMVGHIESFNPAIIELSKFVQEEEIIAIEARRCSPYDPRIYDTNVIMDLMIHDLGIVFNDICPEEIKDISAKGNHFFSPVNFDYVQALIKLKNDIVVSITASRSTEKKIRDIVIHAKDGYIVADLLNKNLTISRSTNFESLNGQNYKYKQSNVVETIQLTFDEPLKSEHTEFYTAIMENREPKTGSEYAIRAIKIANQIESLCGE